MEKQYKEYAEVMVEKRKLEEKLDELKSVIIQSLKKEPEQKKETDFGSFTLNARKQWVYTDKVKKMEEKVLIAKDKEQKQGVAKALTSEYVTFTTARK